MVMPARRPYLRIVLLAGIALGLQAVMPWANQTKAGQAEKRRQTEDDKLLGLPAEARARVRKAMKAVGLVMVGNDEGAPIYRRGSGVLVRKDGLVVTSAHVISQDDSGEEYRVLCFSLPSDSGEISMTPGYRLKTLDVDKARDLALLQLLPPGPVKAGKGKMNDAPLNLPSLEIGNSREVETLDDLIIIGYPGLGGRTPTVSKGIVEGIDANDEWIKTDGRLLRGNSGGAAVSPEGKLIGIATLAMFDRVGNHAELGGIGFLRPAHLVEQMLERIGAREDGKIIPESPEQKARNNARDKTKDSVEAVPETMILLRGVIKDAATGTPIPDANVTLIPAGQKPPAEALGRAVTNPDGYFQLEKPVKPGRYTLRAASDARYAVFNREVEIKKDSVLLVVELQPAKK